MIYTPWKDPDDDVEDDDPDTEASDADHDVIHIGPRARRPKRAPVLLADVDDIAPDDADDDGYDALGSLIALPLWKARSSLLRIWQAIGDRATVDRGWGALPSPPGDALLEGAAVAAALDRALSLDAVRQMALDGGWSCFTGIDLAGGTKATADFFAALTLAWDPKADRYVVLDLRHERGTTISRQVAIVREIDTLWSPRFRIEGNGPGFSNARHLTNQLTDAEAFATTKQSKWSQEYGIPALVALFGARRITIPGNAAAQRLLDPLLRELRTFPRGRHDDAFDALTFAHAAAVLDPSRRRKPMPRMAFFDL